MCVRVFLALIFLNKYLADHTKGVTNSRAIIFILCHNYLFLHFGAGCVDRLVLLTGWYYIRIMHLFCSCHCVCVPNYLLYTCIKTLKSLSTDHVMIIYRSILLLQLCVCVCVCVCILSIISPMILASHHTQRRSSIYSIDTTGRCYGP